MIFYCPDCQVALSSSCSFNIMECNRCESKYLVSISFQKIVTNVLELNDRSSLQSPDDPAEPDSDRK